MGLGSAISSGVKALAGATDKIKSMASSTGGFNIGSLAGPLIGAGASLVGGLAAQKAASNQAAYVSSMNYKQAKEFAQNQIQWRVADAKRSGIHPLAALGASLFQAAPQAVGADTSALGNGLSEMGQNISRAIDAYQSREDRLREQEKIDRLNNLRLNLELQKYQADLEESKSRIALNNARVAAEGVAMKNMVARSSWKMQPRVPGRVVPGGSIAPDGSGAVKDYVWFKDEDGDTYMAPSPEYEESVENLPLGIGDFVWWAKRGFAKTRKVATKAGKRANYAVKRNYGLSDWIDSFNNSFGF